MRGYQMRVTINVILLEKYRWQPVKIVNVIEMNKKT